MRKNRLLIAAFGIFGLLLSGLVPTMATGNSTVAINNQPLVFDNGKFSTNLNSLITQTRNSNSNSLDLGVDAELNSYILYYDVFSGVDAVLTITGIQDMDGDAVGFQHINRMDDALVDNPTDFPSTNVNGWITTDLESMHRSGNSWVEYTLEFFQDVDASPRVPVTLTNFVMNTYDIDGSANDGERQYLEISDFSRYELTSPSFLTASKVDNRTRFLSAAIGGSPSDPEHRAKVQFDSASRIVFRLGQLTLSGDPSATFFMDFSAGPTWNPAPAVVSPVIAAQQTTTYTGPIPVSLSVACVPAGVASTAVLSGERLNTITSAEVAGKAITVSEATASSIKLAIPALTAGTYSIIYNSSSGRLTHQDSLRVCSSSAAPAQPGQFTAQRLFANYRGDRGPVIARDRAAITAFINQYKGITTVRCVGSTSGVPAKRTDPALAQARAKNACDIVKRLVPNATISLETSTGKGIGQRFRSVTIFISGTN